jgi:hypothetical protein
MYRVVAERVLSNKTMIRRPFARDGELCTP